MRTDQYEINDSSRSVHSFAVNTRSFLLEKEGRSSSERQLSLLKKIRNQYEPALYCDQLNIRFGFSEKEQIKYPQHPQSAYK